jgi:hypothetical protein
MSTLILSTGVISASGFDPDAITFLNAAGITDTTQRYAVNTAVRDLKNAGIWNELDAAYPIVGSTATTQKYNLKNPLDTDGAYRMEFYGGISHGVNGFAGNGSNAYADTNFDVASLTQNDSHICYYQRFNATPSGSGDIDMGSFDEPGTNGVFLAGEIVTDLARGRMYQGAVDYTNSDPRGFFLITANADTRMFKNGSQVASLANSGTFPLSTGNIYISAMNRNAIPSAGYYTSGNYAWASIGKGLTNTQVSDYYTIVQAYQTTLGRQV